MGGDPDAVGCEDFPLLRREVHKTTGEGEGLGVSTSVAFEKNPSAKIFEQPIQTPHGSGAEADSQGAVAENG